MTTESAKQLHVPPENLVTVGDALRWAEAELAAGQVFLGHGTDSFHDEAVALLLYVLDLPWDTDAAVLSEPMSAGALQHLADLLGRRIDERVPTPYLTGTAWFAGLAFRVDERVLIPRSPLAELIEQGFAPWLDAERVTRVLDLCTGSGCIAIACAHAFPAARVDASDIDAGALEVCRENIARHGLEDRVFVHQGDGLAAVAGRYELIVCNPPYVDAADMATLPAEYRHEPEHALASGCDGLDFTRGLLARAADYLSEDGILVVEVGNSMEAVEATWPRVPFLWLEFERGGDGVFLLTRDQLDQYRDLFRDGL